MAVEALVCDASGTLVDDRGRRQAGVLVMLERLRALGIQIVIAANQHEAETRELLGSLGDFVDHLICHEHVQANKG